MKFINYLESISGIGIYPMISLLMFFVFFLILGIRVFRMEKASVDYAGLLPLKDSVSEEEKN